MRVIHLSKVTGIAGSEGHLLRLLPGLVQHGLDVHMLVLEDPRFPADSFCEALQSQKVQAERIPIRSHLDPLLPGRLTRRLAALQPDLVHTHLLHADLYGLPAARRAGVPHAISSRHNNDAFRHNPLIKWINRRAMRHASRVITISHALARFVKEVEGIADYKVMTVHYGLEAPEQAASLRETARADLGYTEDIPLVGVFGRLVHQKGIDTLLRAFATVRHNQPQAVLLVVGDGPLRTGLEQQARDLNLSDAVTFTGWIDQARRLMPACDVIVVPSRWEGFGLVTLEAMGCALPLVASRTSALPEIINEGETGFLVEPDNPPELAQAINRLLADPSLARNLGQAGYDRLVTHFSIEKMVNATLDVYSEVTNMEEGAAN
jgi:glycosyltransferase involved in cell wall biosynthesis